MEQRPINAIKKMQVVEELLQIGKRAFLYKLKQQHPDWTAAQVEVALKDWYLHRPGAEHGDGDGVPGDISRFFK